jgi:hypothetical protein
MRFCSSPENGSLRKDPAGRFGGGVAESLVTGSPEVSGTFSRPPISKLFVPFPAVLPVRNGPAETGCRCFDSPRSQKQRTRNSPGIVFAARGQFDVRGVRVPDAMFDFEAFWKKQMRWKRAENHLVPASKDDIIVIPIDYDSPLP